MKKNIIRLPILKFIVVVIIFAIILLSAFYFYKSNKDNCVNPFEVKDFTSGKEAVRICNDVLFRGSTKVVGKDEYPDLFEFLLNEDSKPDEVKQYVRVFEKDKHEYVSVKSIIDYTSWHNSSIGIYVKEDKEYKLIFKKSFDDNQGRWVNIEFGEDYTSRDPYFNLTSTGEGVSISGDLGYLGCLGCRLLWWDYYVWDAGKKTFVLANNKYPENFKRLLEDYEEKDKTTCFDQEKVSESISDLYLIRKDKDKICADDAIEPATTISQAEMLLKAKEAIRRIINGENIPMSKVDEVKINL